MDCSCASLASLRLAEGVSAALAGVAAAFATFVLALVVGLSMNSMKAGVGDALVAAGVGVARLLAGMLNRVAEGMAEGVAAAAAGGTAELPAERAASGCAGDDDDGCSSYARSHSEMSTVPDWLRSNTANTRSAIAWSTPALDITCRDSSARSTHPVLSTSSARKMRSARSRCDSARAPRTEFDCRAKRCSLARKLALGGGAGAGGAACRKLGRWGASDELFVALSPR